MVACKYFTGPGGCRAGDSCRYEHVQRPMPGRGGRNPNDLPNLISGLTLPPSTAPTSRTVPHIPCRLYARGACRYGDGCRFQHTRQPEAGFQQNDNLPFLKSLPGSHAGRKPPRVESTSRTMAGASVSFGGGAQVLAVNTAATSTGSNMLINVKCVWAQPSKSAVLEFSEAADARAALINLTASEIRGRAPRILPAAQDSTSTQTLRVGNLHAETQEEMLRDVCKDHQPWSVTFGEPSYASTFPEVSQSIQERLSTKGKVIAWRTTESIKQRAKATATFQSIKEAQSAVSMFDGYRLPQLRGSRIWLSLVLTVKIPVLRILFQRLRASISQIKVDLQSEGHLDIMSCAPQSAVERFTPLSIVSDSVQRLAKAKAAVEKILAGHTAKSGQDTIWLDFFSTPEGITYLRDLGTKHDVFVYSNKTERTVSLYGEDDKVILVETTLAKFVTNTRHSLFSSHAIKLNNEDWPTGTNDLVHNELVARFGIQNVRFKTATEPNLIDHVTILGTSEDADRAKWIVRQLNGDAIRTKSSAASEQRATTKVTECAVCCCPVPSDEMYTPPCGHIYDHSCFISQCRYADSPHDFPLRCLGAASKCTTILSLTELQSVLKRDDFDALLARSFTAYLREHPTDYRYCPTAGCETIYAPTEDGAVVTCPACLTAICSTCHVANHEGMTCRQYKLSKVEDSKFAAWKKKTGAQACPKCGAVIMKAEGCNHVQCASCKGHMCWRCGKGFEQSGDVYAHLTSVHRGVFGDGEAPDEWGQGAGGAGLVDFAEGDLLGGGEGAWGNAWMAAPDAEEDQLLIDVGIPEDDEDDEVPLPPRHDELVERLIDDRW